jgi:hypothetical protein
MLTQTFLENSQTSKTTTTVTLPVSRAFFRAVVSTGRRFLGPQLQEARARASYCPRALHVRSETFFLLKKSSLTTAMTILMSRAFQRCVVSTGRRFLGPQLQEARARASYCLRALHVRSETFFLHKKKQPDYCNDNPDVTGFPTMRHEHQ